MHDEREEAHQHIVLSLGSLIAQAPAFKCSNRLQVSLWMQCRIRVLIVKIQTETDRMGWALFRKH